MKRRIVLLAERIDLHVHKSANVLLRYLADEIVGIIDPHNRGKTVAEILGGDYDIPVASSLEELLEYNPNYLLVGFLPAGGLLKTDWYPVIIKALQSKINIISGLHQNLKDVAEFSLLAKKYKTRLYHLREQVEYFYRPRPAEKRAFATILTLDTDLSAWDLATILELFRSFKKKSYPVKWVPTSILGNLIKKQEQVAESVSADQLSAFISEQVYKTGREADYVFVEGFASFTDFSTRGAAVSVLTGSQPDGIILCHTITSSVFSEIASAINYQIEIIKSFSANKEKTPVIGLSLNTAFLDEREAKDVISLMESEFTVPVIDPLRFGTGALLREINSLWSG